MVELYNSITDDDPNNPNNTIKKKDMFSPFMNSSPELKAVIYLFMKRIYETEEIPTKMFEMVLFPLFKKGDRRKLSNYRFLHLRSFLPRILEMLIYEKLEKSYESLTEECQYGGKKMSDTTEHLTQIFHKIKECEEKGEGAIVTLADIQKCFDRIWLVDSIEPLTINDDIRKPVKLLFNSKNINNIKIKDSEHGFKQKSGLGQGGTNDPRQASLVITKTLNGYFILHPAPTKFNGTIIELSQFVDDSSTLSTNTGGKSAAENAAISGNLMTAGMDEISLKSHPEKTCQNVVGKKEFGEKMKKEMTEKHPTYIQGTQTRLSTEDKLLGIYIIEGTLDEIIMYNLRKKKEKCENSARIIRNFLQDPIIKRIGVIKTASMLYQAIIIPQFMYGFSSFPSLSKKRNT